MGETAAKYLRGETIGAGGAGGRFRRGFKGLVLMTVGTAFPGASPRRTGQSLKIIIPRA